jgi:hypothetical protein
LKAKFEELAKAPPPTHSVEDIERERIVQEEIRKKTWQHSGHTGGGHTGHDGKFAAGEKVVQQEVKVVEVVKKTTFAKPPPAPKSLSDLP